MPMPLSVIWMVTADSLLVMDRDTVVALLWFKILDKMLPRILWYAILSRIT